MTPRQDLPSRVWSRVESTPLGCWIWTGPCAKGYGRVSVREAGSRRSMQIHRYAYEQLVGPIPDGLQLDHLCRNRACCNPAHLEPVTSRENTLRGTNQVARQAAATHCVHGHEFTPENTYVEPGGRRKCRTCQRRFLNEWRSRKAHGAPVLAERRM